ncbi:hypothetical protein [Edaphobacter aggregans]|nr:hypothetical protein [Edaphobacter aggregans]
MSDLKKTDFQKLRDVIWQTVKERQISPKIPPTPPIPKLADVIDV